MNNWKWWQWVLYAIGMFIGSAVSSLLFFYLARKA